MNEAAAPRRAKPAPIFELDLGGNGGLLAPANLIELRGWVGAELLFWEWLPRRNFGMHSSAASEAYSYLSQAQSHVDAAGNAGSNQSKEWVASQVESAKAFISNAFLTRRLPHSSTPVAKRIQAFKDEAGEEAASFYITPFLDNLNQQQSHGYAPNSVAGWHGAVAGQIDRHNLNPASRAGRKDAAEKAMEELRLKMETLLGEKGVAIEELHRAFESRTQDLDQLTSGQNEAFGEAQGERSKAFETLTSAHDKSLETIRKTFIDEMAMRAPAAYWGDKQVAHAKWVERFTWITFGGIAAALVALGVAVGLMLYHLPSNATHPPPWQLAVLALGGVLVIWALRLVVRMYLSHIHLERDADERIVMVKTYLALLEAQAMDSNEHRQLILNALFRPASDGIVKDEAMPFSVAELLTRSGKP